MSRSSLQIDALSTQFGGSSVLDEVSLNVWPGEILAIVGPSGCGKSTLLRVLAGLLEPDGGRVFLDDREVRGPSQHRALVFQDDALLPWRSARRNVELPLALRGVPRAERRERADTLLAQVGLQGFERHLPRQLSGGMRQRVQLARTLVGSPRVLLMDEPFGALDSQTRQAAQRLLVDVWEKHPVTIVLVTHDVDEALTLADRVVVLTARPGRVRRIVDVPKPRVPGARFEPAFARARYEILAALGSDEPASVAGAVTAAGAPGETR